MWSFSKFLKETTCLLVIFCFPVLVLAQDCPTDPVITGPGKLCPDDKGIVYSIPAYPAGSTYNWVGPPGTTITPNNNQMTLDVTGPLGGSKLYVKINGTTCDIDSVELKIVLVPLPIVSIEETASICAGETYTVKSASVDKEKDFVWEVANGGGDLTNTTGLTPTYTPVATDAGKVVQIILKANAKDPCTQVVEAILNLSVTGSGSTKEEIQGDRTVCELTTHHYVMPEVAGATDYKWEFPNGMTGVPNKNECDVTFGSASGTIFVHITTNCGLDTVGQKIIVVKNPVAEVEEKAAICAGESYTVQRGLVDNEDAFTWEVIGGNPANLQGGDTPTPTYNSQPNEGGNRVQLVLKATAKTPCVTEATATLEIAITTTADFSIVEEQSCPNIPVTLKVISAINDPSITYDWYTMETGGTSIFTGTEMTIRNPTSDTTFWVEAVGGCGAVRVPATIKLLPKPLAKFTANTNLIGENGQEVEFTDASIGGTEGTWSFGLGQTAAYVPGEKIAAIYNFDGVAPDVIAATLVVKNAEGCIDVDTVFIDVDLKWALFVPNIFTPNQDGLNDELNFMGYGINELEIQIFNKWGEKVYESSDLSSTWDGKNRKGNRDVSDGVYVYSIKITNLNGEKVSYNGHVSLVR